MKTCQTKDVRNSNHGHHNLTARVMNMLYLKASFINHRVKRKLLIRREVLDEVNSDSENSASYSLLELCKWNRRYTSIIKLQSDTKTGNF